MSEKESDEKGITVKKNADFSEWYVQAVTKSEFLDYTDVSGAIALRPLGYFVWQTLVDSIDLEFAKSGIENVYFPLFIPERFLNKEKEHVEGFNPEVAWVTQTGENKLKERFAIRPTSETIMYPSYSKWIRSWRDLPLRYNQWNNVVRWEFKDPTPLIRSREFLWSEGHSVFASEDAAWAERDVILGIYQKVLREVLALPGIMGQKTDREKFAGAEASFSIEHLLPNGLALQGPDFHFDGQKFSKVFEIKFLDKDGKKKYAFQNTFGISWRELGAMIGIHGDDKGLILPPKVAQIQVVIVPIFNKENMRSVLEFSRKVEKLLQSDYRVRVDDAEGYSPGYKFHEWELRGVPVRIEIGPREVEKKQIVLVRRDTGAKAEIDTGNLSQKVSVLLADIHKSLYSKAQAFLDANTHSVEDYASFKKVLKEKSGFIRAPWCGDSGCEEKIKEETGAKITNIPFEQGRPGKKCVYCGKKPKHMVNFAKSY